jgi:hypothetical protein
MIEKFISLLAKDWRIGIIAVLIFAIWQLFGLYNSDKVMDIEEKKNCEVEKRELQKKLDSANNAILSIYQLKSMKNDTN